MIKKLLDSYRKVSLPVKASIWFVICNVLQKGISFITVPIFTRIMSTEQYGMYSVYLSWESIISIFLTLRIAYTAYNNCLVKHDDDIDRVTSSFQGLATVITGAVFAVYLIFQEPINNLLEMNTLMVSLMFLQILVLPAYELWTARQRFLYNYKAMVAVSMGIAIFNPLLGVIAVLLSEDKALARVATVVLVQVIFCGSIYIYNFYKGKKFFVKDYWKYALAVSVPLLPHYLSTTIMNQADKLMIQKMCGLTDAAIYSVSHSVAYLVNLFTSAINNSILPWTYQHLKAKDYKSIYKYTHLFLLLVGFLILGIIAFGPDIVKIMATEEYYDAVWVIPPLAGGLFFCFLYQLCSNVEFYYEYRKPSLYIALSATLINVVTNYIFIGKFGFIAAGYTTLFSYVYFALMHYAVMTRIVKKELHINQVFNNKAILGIVVVFSAFLVLFTMTYEYNIVRYAVILIIVMIAIIKRKSVIEIIKSVRGKNK